jgi:hypothetical protein
MYINHFYLQLVLWNYVLLSRYSAKVRAGSRIGILQQVLSWGLKFFGNKAKLYIMYIKNKNKQFLLHPLSKTGRLSVLVLCEGPSWSTQQNNINFFWLCGVALVFKNTGNIQGVSKLSLLTSGYCSLGLQERISSYQRGLFILV